MLTVFSMASIGSSNCRPWGWFLNVRHCLLSRCFCECVGQVRCAQVFFLFVLLCRLRTGPIPFP